MLGGMSAAWLMPFRPSTGGRVAAAAGEAGVVFTDVTTPAGLQKAVNV